MDLLSSLGGMVGAMLAVILTLCMALLPILMLAFAIWPLIGFGAEPLMAAAQKPTKLDRVKRDEATKALFS